MSYLKRKAINVLAAVFGMIVLGIALGIAPYIYDKVVTNIGTPSAAAGVAVQGNVTSNVYAGLQLGSIAPILQAVGIVLALLGTFFYMTRG